MKKGRLWEIEEEEIICRGVINHRKDTKKYADKILKELHDKGYTDRDIKSVEAKIGDYRKILKGKGESSNVAPKSKRVFERVSEELLRIQRQFDDYLKEIYGNNGLILDYDIGVDLSDPNNLTITKDIFPTSSSYSPNVSITKGKSFREMFWKLIVESGTSTDSQIYGKYGEYMDKKTFSKLKNGDFKNVTKRRVVQLCFAFHLSLEEAIEFLKSAGFAFSEGILTDCIVMCALKDKIYDIYEIDDALTSRGLEPLFE